MNAVKHPAPMLENIAFYERHKAALKVAYPGKYLVIRQGVVWGDFGSWPEAGFYGLQLFPDEQFLIRFCP